MALIQFQHLDPVRHLLALQKELERFQRNPDSASARPATGLSAGQYL